MRSGSSSGSTRLANEYRSRRVEREDNGYSSVGGGGSAEGAAKQDLRLRKGRATHGNWGGYPRESAQMQHARLNAAGAEALRGEG